MSGKSDWKYINLKQDYEIDYLLNKYGYAVNEKNRDLFRQYIEEAKEYFGKAPSDNLEHDEFYKFMCEQKGYSKK